MRNYWYILALTVAVLLSACNSEKRPEELFEQQQSGVCLVLNSYYFQIKLPNGTMWYCSGIDEDGDLDNFTTDEDDIKDNKSMATGTAFFIDNRGTLMTNRHVVSPVVSEETIRNSASFLLQAIKAVAQNAQSEYYTQYNQLEQAKSTCYNADFWGNYQVDNNKLQQIIVAQQELSDKYDEAQSAVSAIEEMNMEDIKVTSVNEIGIAYNDTYVTNVDDFLQNNPCVVTKVSRDEDTDLATIQLKNKKTPEDKYIFRIKGRDDIDPSFTQRFAGIFKSKKDDALSVNKGLIMIGFNAGLILGSTQQGIKAQMTTGIVTQQPDGKRVLYSIPTMQGSSGSPVIDHQGYVRAVNFAKLKGTDNFNFGIPENLILKFLNE